MWTGAPRVGRAIVGIVVPARREFIEQLCRMPLLVIRATRGLPVLLGVCMAFGRAPTPASKGAIVALVVRVAVDRKPPPLLSCLIEIAVVAGVGAM
jgi:hypothetical protein